MLRQNVDKQDVYVICLNSSISFINFKNKFNNIDAAGGVVKNLLSNNYLFIKRLGFWDLPKGKFEKVDNNFFSCAIREVSEECGIPLELLKVKDDLPFVTSHYYLCAYTNRHIIKNTYWFKMETEAVSLIPQYEEDIELCKWLSKKEIEKEVLLNTYSTIKEILKFFFVV